MRFTIMTSHTAVKHQYVWLALEGWSLFLKWTTVIKHETSVKPMFKKKIASSLKPGKDKSFCENFGSRSIPCLNTVDHFKSVNPCVNLNLTFLWITATISLRVQEGENHLGVSVRGNNIQNDEKRTNEGEAESGANILTEKLEFGNRSSRLHQKEKCNSLRVMWCLNQKTCLCQENKFSRESDDLW